MIGAEKLSDFTDWTDRSTCILFGDGAGAAVVTATADGRAARHRSGGVGLGARSAATRSRIEGWRPYIAAGGPGGLPLGHHGARPDSPCRPASGPASRPSEIAAFVPHQANLRIIDGIAKRLGMPQRGDRQGHRRVRQHLRREHPAGPVEAGRAAARCPPGAPVLLFGFGGGLTYAGQVVRCP